MRGLVLVLALCLVVGVLGDWSLTHKYTAYDIQKEWTVFGYEIQNTTTISSAVDGGIARITIGAPGCTSDDISLVSGSGWSWVEADLAAERPAGVSFDCLDKTDCEPGIIELAIDARIGHISTTGDNGDSSARTILDVDDGTGIPTQYQVIINSDTWTPYCSLSYDYPTAPADFALINSTTIQCDENVTAPPTADYTAVKTELETGRCEDFTTETITWHYKAHQEEKYYSRFTQVVNREDTEPPEWVNNSIQDEIWNCKRALVDGALNFPPLAARDSCDDQVDIIHCNGTVRTGTVDCEFNYFLTNTWTATDRCGNSKCKTQTITVRDPDPPTFEVFGNVTDATYECNANPDYNLTAPTIIQSDACDSNINGTLLPVVTIFNNSGNCPSYTLERVWTATDSCQNTRSLTQYVYVKDTTAPVINLEGLNNTDRRNCTHDPDFELNATDACLNNTILLKDQGDPRESITRDHCAVGGFQKIMQYEHQTRCRNLPNASLTHAALLCVGASLVPLFVVVLLADDCCQPNYRKSLAGGTQGPSPLVG